MGLAADLAAASTRVGGRQPKVSVLLETLDGPDREALERALEDKDRVSASELARVLRSHGHEISAGAIKRWREGDVRR